MNEPVYNEVIEHIQYEWDGPVDNYVAIFRALRMARNRPDISIDRIAEALLDTIDLAGDEIVIRPRYET
jgi:hypothetical protein